MIKSIEISNFKGIQNLKIKPKKINLLIGRNNTGKTTILEALNLFFNNDAVIDVEDTHSYFNIYSGNEKIKISVEQEGREKEIIEIKNTTQLELVDSFGEEFADFFFSYIHDLKESSSKDKIKKELVKSIEKNMTRKLREIFLKNSVLLVNREGKERVYYDYSNFLTSDDLENFSDKICDYINEKFLSGNKKEYDKLKIKLRFALFSMAGLNDRYSNKINFKNENVIFIKNLLEEVEEYGSLKKSLQPEESKRLYQIVKIIKDSNLVKNLEDLKFDNVVFLGSDGEPKAHSFEFLGDGFKALIGLLWKLSSKKIDNSIVLIDEPENHMHPGYIKELINFISDFSEKRNIQFFMVTHSQDLLREILSEESEKSDFLKQNLNLLKLSNLNDSTIVAESLDYKEAKETQEELLLDLRGV